VSDGTGTVDARALAVTWAEKARRHLATGPAPDEVTTVRSWARGGAAMHYASGRPADVLVIGLTGNMRRLMLPAPVILQQLYPFGADLLMLWSRSGTAFRSGVAGHSPDLPGTVAWLRETVASHGARRIVILGTSAGAFPAILVAHALGADAVLAAGTRVTAPETYWPDAPVPDIGDVVASAAQGTVPPVVHLVFGADSEPDVTDAHRVAEAVPTAHLITIDGAGHSCLAPLVHRRQLQSVLASTLFARVPSPGS
jgi:hypothetical protein